MCTPKLLSSRSALRDPDKTGASLHGAAFAKGSRVTVRLEPSFPWREALHSVQEQLRRSFGHVPGRMIPERFFHLSLVSADTANSSHVEQIESAVERVVQDCYPFELHLDNLDTFGRSSSPTLIYAGVRGELEGLDHLWRALRLMDPRRNGDQLKPHITLVDLSSGLSPEVVSQIRHILGHTVIPASEPFIVDRVWLLHRIIEPGGKRYERLPSVPIGGVPMGC